MEKTFRNSLLLSLFIIPLSFALTACGNGEDEYHMTAFVEMQPLLYADQTTDSVHLQYTDAWKAEGYDSWLTITPTEEGPLPSGYLYATRTIKLNATPNTTGRNRVTLVNIKSEDRGASIAISQVAWLNIKYPAMRPSQETFAELKADFGQTMPDTAATTMLAFTIYSDAATLTSDADWLTIDKAEFKAGEHVVSVSTQKNTTGTDRTAHLTLTSNAVSTPITYVQVGK